MSGDDEPVDTCCASCGKAEIDDIKLVSCDDCDLVKYCSDDCRENHKSEHEEDCKKRAAELREELLFKQPEGTHYGDCPVCMIPMPLHPLKSAIYVCCGKTVCNGCLYADNTRGITPNPEVFACPPGVFACPFCRKPAPKTNEEMYELLMKRVEMNDPVALCLLGGKCEIEGHYSRAFECFTKAAELGDANAHYNLSIMYHAGKGVEVDEGKKKHHLEEAAIRGHPHARYMLGCHENKSGNVERAVKHWIIAATQGLDVSMQALMQMFKDGLVQKESLASVLRAHQAAVDAAKSPQRQVAEDYARNRELLKEMLTAEDYEAFKRRTQMPCAHRAMSDFVGVNDFCCYFATAFAESFHKNVEKFSLWNRFIKARDATKIVDVWNDSAQLETVMSYLLCDGVQFYLEGSYDLARDTATMIRILEQYIAIELHRTQALYNWPKVEDTYYADLHTLVKFYRHRIPCSCLDEKYEEVKDIPKMGFCYNPECSIPNREVERSKTKCCSRCRNVTYCSRECQVADWSRHKPICDENADRIAKFEAGICD